MWLVLLCSLSTALFSCVYWFFGLPLPSGCFRLATVGSSYPSGSSFLVAIIYLYQRPPLSSFQHEPIPFFLFPAAFLFVPSSGPLLLFSLCCKTSLLFLVNLITAFIYSVVFFTFRGPSLLFTLVVSALLHCIFLLFLYAVSFGLSILCALIVSPPPYVLYLVL